MNIRIDPSRQLKTKRSKTGPLQLLIMFVMGAIFLVAGFFIGSSMSIPSEYIRTEGKVVDTKANNSGDGGTTYAAVVEYTVNSETYTVTASESSSSAPTVGEIKEVGYDPERPQVARVAAGSIGSLLPWIFGGAGVLLIVFGLFLFISSSKRSASIKRLMNSGHKVQGVVTELKSTNQNGIYKVVVTAPNSQGGSTSYESDHLEGLGSIAMMDFQKNPIPVDVFIDPANPENYYVDVADLPNLTPERIQQLVKGAISSRTQPQTIQNVATSQPPSVQPAPPQPPQQPPQPNVQPQAGQTIHPTSDNPSKQK